MKLFLLIALCGVSALHAQVSLVIIDERPDGFYLGINGYLQNEDKKKQLMVTGLDTSKHVISIRTGATEFSKTIQLKESGTHKYVLTNDYYGKLKLRYRGNQLKAPSNISSMPISKEVKWPVLASSTIAVTAAIPETKTTVTDEGPLEGIQTLEGQSSHIAKPDTLLDSNSSSDSAVAENIALIARTDTSSNSAENNEKRDSISKPAGGSAAFKSVLSALKAQDFEFDKLSICQEYLEGNTISAKQLGQFFELLKYDQTRMQLIKSSSLKVSDPEYLDDLSRYFEYEISKSQYILYLNE